ncbi:MAG: hypothetical protein ACOYK9_06570 [Chlamydiia bacterium]
MYTNDFFSFDSPLAKSSIYAPPINLPGNSSNLAKGIFNDLDFPIIFKIKMGSKFNDLIDVTAPPLYLISEKFRNILIEYNLSGWKTFPIIFLDKHDQKIRGYHGFSITGKCNFINNDNSEIIELQHAPNLPIDRHYKGISVDGWDGSDFFCPKLSRHLFVSSKAADVIKKEKITNVSLCHAQDYTDCELSVQIRKEKQAAHKQSINLTD